MKVPIEYHRGIIGQKGQNVRDMMNAYDVYIDVPSADQEEDVIRLEVDSDFHPKIIGKRGVIISKIRDKYNVQINFPRRGDPDESIITIQGYEEQANAARDEILSMVQEYNQLTKEEVEIDARVHSRLIGSRGWSIRKIMDEFNVEIKFPKTGSDNPNLVTIIGSEDAVFNAKDHLLNLEEEYLSSRTHLALLSSSRTLRRMSGKGRRRQFGEPRPSPPPSRERETAVTRPASSSKELLGRIPGATTRADIRGTSRRPEGRAKGDRDTTGPTERAKQCRTRRPRKIFRPSDLRPLRPLQRPLGGPVANIQHLTFEKAEKLHPLSHVSPNFGSGKYLSRLTIMKPLSMMIPYTSQFIVTIVPDSIIGNEIGETFEHGVRITNKLIKILHETKTSHFQRNVNSEESLPFEWTKKKQIRENRDSSATGFHCQHFFTTNSRSKLGTCFANRSPGFDVVKNQLLP
ncbi:unnamed protein product, partial [Nesidiocoris tenuis]